MTANTWAIRPYPHGIYRVQEFMAHQMAALGWPLAGDLAGCDRERITGKLAPYNESPRQLGQATGIVDRFVNQIEIGDAIAVPDGAEVYFGVVTGGYSFRESLAGDEEGYPHWIAVEYKFGGHPVLREELPALLFDSLKGRQTVFSLPAEEVWRIINNPQSFDAVDTGDRHTKAEYVKGLLRGTLAGINSPRFEKAVLKVLSFYFPGLLRLATTNAPAGADTDLKTSLPGGIVVRVQVKCYQDEYGELGEYAVRQLRASMEAGEHGLIVTTNRASLAGQQEASSDSLTPIGIIDGPEFAELVFDNLERLDDEDLWTLGLGRALRVR